MLVRPFGDTTVRTPTGFRVAQRHAKDFVYRHDYQGGYEQYRATQVFHDKRKLDEVWADEREPVWVFVLERNEGTR